MISINRTDKGKIISFIKKFLLGSLPISNVQAIYIFGSFGSANGDNYHDIDIGIKLTQSIETAKLWRIGQSLANQLDVDIDLIDLNKASDVMRFQIISTGQRIFCQDENKIAFFENQVYSMYLDLNETRKHIIGAYMQKAVG